MENMNNFQGKTPQQYSNSAKIAWYGVVGMIVLFNVVNAVKEYIAGITIPLWFPIKKAARMWFLD